jgi:hypothetical protein
MDIDSHAILTLVQKLELRDVQSRDAQADQMKYYS